MTTTFADLAGKAPRQATPPSGSTAGDLYIDSTNDALMAYDGSVWRGVALSTTTTSTSSSTSTTTTSTSTTTS